MIETRLPCPVCLGPRMEKEVPDGRTDIALDLCPRCGGLWFDAGEVQLLRSGSRFVLPAPATERHRFQCHSCTAILDREAADCPACGYGNRLSCPRCETTMDRAAHEGVILDMCKECRGVWFDRHELAAIWTLVLTAAVDRASQSGLDLAEIGGVMGDSTLSLLEVLAYSPDVGVVIVEGTVEAVGGSIQIVAAIPEVAGVVAEAAGAVFEVLIEIVAGILSGL